MTHPKTGHQGHTQKPNKWEKPKDVTITISQSLCDVEDVSSRTCARGTRSCIADHVEPDPGDHWYAEIRGNLPNGDEFYQVTNGETQAHAVHMAADIMRMVWEECLPEDGEPGMHCYCRDATYSWHDSDEVWRYVGCCLCDVKVAVSEFEDA